jgi:hypothetical protein
MRPNPKSRYRLLAEGSDDKHSIIQLLARHGFDWDDETLERPFVEDAGGVERLLETLPTALKVHHRLGVVLDADTDPLSRWQAVRDRARSVGVALAAEPQAAGTVVTSLQASWKFGVWLMPDNAARGALEDFLALLVPPGDPCWSHADAATRTAREVGAQLAEKDHLKGALHAWLAWQELPGQPFGTAITARTFRHDSAEALQFVAWFRALFGA